MEANANKKYKDSLFTWLFQTDDKRIELYNALTGSNLPPDTPIEDATLPDVLFLNQMNDMAFVIEGRLVVLVEHQSTINENMPLRLLTYIGRVYEKLVGNDNVYRKTRITVPKPEFYVIYNGKDEYPDQETLRLSDAFANAGEMTGFASRGMGTLLELEVNVINVNAGHSEDIVKRSEQLNGYSTFVGKVRSHMDAGDSLEEAFKKASAYCMEHGVLEHELSDLAKEVLNMLTAEFNMETAQRVWLEEGIEKGIEKGVEKGRQETTCDIISHMLTLGLPVEQIASYSGLPMAQVVSIKNKLTN